MPKGAARSVPVDALLDHLQVGAAELNLVRDVGKIRSERPSRSDA
jgi:hypothetical protein